LLPFTFTRPVAEIRVGILTIREKWELAMGGKVSFKTVDYLSYKFPVEFSIDSDNVWVNASFLPDPELTEQIKNLGSGKVIYYGDEIAAFNSGNDKTIGLVEAASFEKIEGKGSPLRIRQPWDIFTLNGEAIKRDFSILTGNVRSGILSNSNRVFGDHPVFVGESVVAECSVFNTTAGPIYLGNHSEVMEGCVIRGPFALGEHATLKMGAKIYGPTTIGPYCKVGGEVNNSVFFAYSNKAHDGFIGNSVIGEWCNLGADTNNSNLKNNYAPVKVWNYKKERFLDTGLTFCGLLMGDHSKSGINTMFNTGTVVGVSANIFGSGFPRNFVPSFSWGGASGFTDFRLKDAFEVAERMMERRGLTFSEEDKNIFSWIYQESERFRRR
jgi:UDP-N-acetylglucosamine diphosphorylase/glucosamine-1-phosphate N-acetyltransferase